MRVLVTGSSGLIGSEAVQFYDAMGCETLGLDCDARKTFFGEEGSTDWNRERLMNSTRNFTPINCDIREWRWVATWVREFRPDVVVHCAAQPSHDRARDIPILDFETNALGTLHMLEATRQYAPEAVFIHVSTSKVYGDNPNKRPAHEGGGRFIDTWGIDETMSIDQCLHSLFGASKAAGDLMAQEYGRYYGLKVGIFRPGCLTGPFHSSVEQHGFLHYLVKCAIEGRTYRVFGYNGKQVRDNLHSYDTVTAFHEFVKNPRPGEVYNLGGGFENSCSILEAFELVKEVTGRTVQREYVDKVRLGDHRCWITDLSKFRSHFPDWKITKDLRMIVREIAEALT